MFSTRWPVPEASHRFGTLRLQEVCLSVGLAVSNKTRDLTVEQPVHER